MDGKPLNVEDVEIGQTYDWKWYDHRGILIWEDRVEVVRKCSLGAIVRVIASKSHSQWIKPNRVCSATHTVASGEWYPVTGVINTVITEVQKLMALALP